MFHASMGRLTDEQARASDVTSEGRGGRGPWHRSVTGVLAARIRGPDLGDSEGGGVAKLLQILSSSFSSRRAIQLGPVDPARQSLVTCARPSPPFPHRSHLHQSLLGCLTPVTGLLTTLLSLFQQRSVSAPTWLPHLRYSILRCTCLVSTLSLTHFLNSRCCH